MQGVIGRDLCEHSCCSVFSLCQAPSNRCLAIPPPFHCHFSHPCSWRRSLRSRFGNSTAAHNTGQSTLTGMGGLGVYRLGCLHEQSQGVKQIILACVKAAARHKYAWWCAHSLKATRPRHCGAHYILHPYAHVYVNPKSLSTQFDHGMTNKNDSKYK